MVFSSNYTSVMRDLIYKEAGFNDFDNNEFNTQRFVINISDIDTMEIPIFLGEEFKSYITLIKRDYPNYFTKAVIELSIGDSYRNHQVGTVDTFFKRIQRIWNNGRRLEKFIIKDSEIYYASRGIIMDQNFDVLLLTTKIYGDSHRDDKIILYLNPKIFITETLVCKSLAKKGISFFVNESTLDRRIEIKLSDCKDIICKTYTPQPCEIQSEITQKVIEDNIDEILTYILESNYPWR